MRRPHVTDTRRAFRGALSIVVGLLLFATIGIAMPARASAHSYGHLCVHRTSDIPSTGWSCLQSDIIGGQAWIDVYYDGSRRATTDLYYDPASNQLDLMIVCDTNLGDNIRPGLRIEIPSETVFEYGAGTGGAGCLNWDRSYFLVTYRTVTRTPSGAMQHGSISYQP